jgi:alpha-tubulin suppressor-like RCC1 family protein
LTKKAIEVPMRQISVCAVFLMMTSAIACGSSESGTGPEADAGTEGGTPTGDAGIKPATATPSVKVGAPSVTMTTEKGATATFAVVLGSQPSADVTLAIASSDTNEAVVDKASVVFTKSNWDQAQTITVTGVDDDVVDGDKDVTITIAKPASSDAGYAALAGSTVVLKNMDDDTAGIAVAPPTGKTTEKGGTLKFTTQLRSKPSADVTIPVVSSDVAEGTVDKASLVFTAANWNQPQEVTVTGVDDKKADPATAYSVNLGLATSTDALYKDATAKVDLTNTDDDEVVQLSGGHTLACARFVDGRVKCWGGGSGYSAALGLGDANGRGDGPGEMGDALPFVDLGTGRTAKFITAGVYTACAILDDDTLKCWGRNEYGQLGQGDTTVRGGAANQMGDNLLAVSLGAGVKAVTTKYFHVCAILADDSVRCWGLNQVGQLGYGDTTNRGSAANQMGANLLPVALGTGRKARAIAAGYLHTCAILDDQTVKCWGNNSAGQLGYGDTTVRGNTANQMGDSLLAVDLGTGRKAVAISAGESSTCALLDNATVKCWGQGSSGQLGYGDTNARGDGANEMGDNLLAVDVGTGRTVKELTVGWVEACVRLDDDTMKCWGTAVYGELGYGDTTTRGSAANQMGDNLPVVNVGTGLKVKSLSGGILLQGAILSDRTAKLWGYNAFGALGQGDTTQRGSAANQMGDNLLPILLVGP